MISMETSERIRIGIRQRYNIRHAEVPREWCFAITFLECWCHEVAHLQALGYTLNAAAEVAQTARSVGKVIESMRSTVAGRDRNEADATAITVLALADFDGYVPAESIGNMYGNLMEPTQAEQNKLWERAHTSKRNQALAKALRTWLLEFANSTLDDDENYATV